MSVKQGGNTIAGGGVTPDNMVTTDTAQTISGYKTISNDGSGKNRQMDVICENLDLNNLPSSNAWGGIEFHDVNDTRIGKVEPSLEPSGLVRLNLSASQPVNGTMKYASISVCIKPDGTVYTEAPTPASSDNTTKIATTAFVKSVLSSSGNGLATISKATNGYCRFSNGLLIQWGQNSSYTSRNPTITLNQSYTSATSYVVVGSGTYGNTSSNGWNYTTSRTQTNFKAIVDTDMKPWVWIAIGY